MPYASFSSSSVVLFLSVLFVLFVARFSRVVRALCRHRPRRRPSPPAVRGFCLTASFFDQSLPSLSLLSLVGLRCFFSSASSASSASSSASCAPPLCAALSALFALSSLSLRSLLYMRASDSQRVFSPLGVVRRKPRQNSGRIAAEQRQTPAALRRKERTALSATDQGPLLGPPTASKQRTRREPTATSWKSMISSGCVCMCTQWAECGWMDLGILHTSRTAS